MSTRICITGGPGTGKTYLADRIGIVNGTATEASEEVAGWLDRPGPWVIEGVALPRALRKWKARAMAFVNIPIARSVAIQPPCDRLIVLRHSHPSAGPEKPGQASMRVGLFTVLDELLEGWPELRKVTEYR